MGDRDTSARKIWARLVLAHLIGVVQAREGLRVSRWIRGRSRQPRIAIAEVGGFWEGEGTVVGGRGLIEYRYRRDHLPGERDEGGKRVSRTTKKDRTLETAGQTLTGVRSG